jgi:hypothetical protein
VLNDITLVYISIACAVCDKSYPHPCPFCVCHTRFMLRARHAACCVPLSYSKREVASMPLKVHSMQRMAHTMQRKAPTTQRAWHTPRSMCGTRHAARPLAELDKVGNVALCCGMVQQSQCLLLKLQWICGLSCFVKAL